MTFRHLARTVDATKQQQNSAAYQLEEDRVRVLLDLYKFYAKTAETISARREVANKFFLAVNVVVLGGINALVVLGKMAYGLSILGIGVCFVWIWGLRAYKALNSAKFKVILQLEKNFPFSPYSEEKKILDGDSHYVQLTRVETYIPFIFIASYIAMILLSTQD